MSDGSGWQRGLLSELTSDQRLAVFDAWELLSSPTDHRPPAHTSCLYSRHQQLSLWLCQIGDATSVISLLGDGSQEEAVSRTPSGPEPPAVARWVIITSLIMCETRDRFMFIKTLFTIIIHHYHYYTDVIGRYNTSWLVPLKDDIMSLLLFEVYHHSDEADALTPGVLSADAQVRPVIGWSAVDRCGCRSSSCWGSSPVLRLLQLQSTFTYCISIITFILTSSMNSFHLTVHCGFIATACVWAFFKAVL